MTMLQQVLALEVSEAKRWIAAGEIKSWPWLDGSMERYERRNAEGDFSGKWGDNALLRFIGQEAVDLFRGFDNDSDDNRASYAASLHDRILQARAGCANTPVSHGEKKVTP